MEVLSRIVVVAPHVNARGRVGRMLPVIDRGARAAA